MNVAELKRVLEEFPDHYVVVVEEIWNKGLGHQHDISEVRRAGETHNTEGGTVKVLALRIVVR